MQRVAEVVGVNGAEAIKNVGLAAYSANTSDEAVAAFKSGRADLVKALHFSTLLAAEGIVRTAMVLTDKDTGWEDRIRSDINDLLLEAIDSLQTLEDGEE